MPINCLVVGYQVVNNLFQYMINLDKVVNDTKVLVDPEYVIFLQIFLPSFPPSFLRSIEIFFHGN